ncbi:pentapeptide repeat-containing protein [Clostridium swellfunianum]|uniref:pentapeptide repeat-containing protein n=1 Tax=Clostridium swellfunianum TaxID=1367462 RepID=UPI00202DC570|nr:pentapeptide repeat-containing protein [Clostridium swellfunianum]MCM0650049.1 pentapeptide repeat-containing protein [Clostridium swellfunianum]
MKVHEENMVRLGQLKVDCTKCSALCCTALFFSKIDGFPENKKAGKPCTKLENDYRCKIHHELEKFNMKGCIGYDCFGAGQHVTQCIYKGETWQTSEEKSKEIFDVFVIIFQLYQIRYFLEESKIIIPAKELWSDIENLIHENEALCNSTPQSILDIDIESYRNKANIILKQVSYFIIKSFKNINNKMVTELLGKNFKKRNMSGLDLSMKLLIASNFDSCIFDGTIFLGADTRDANFSNADLREAVFLTQGQINSAKGNRSTKLPKHLDYPVTWK